jgi:23S rRNA (cytosine1962-C5)-methyltransferase
MSQSPISVPSSPCDAKFDVQGAVSPQHGAQGAAYGFAAQPRLLVSQGWEDYSLLDSGLGRRLERIGTYTVDRPEPQAMWRRALPDAVWANADAVFVGDSEDDKGRWRFKGQSFETWETALRGVAFLGRLTNFRHLGFFPEQVPHWDWMQAEIRKRKRPKVLNLFAYTGVASLLAADAGAEVTHLDASKKAIGWAQENAALAGLDDAPIRWICDDARKFVAREARRGRVYDGILLDPPKFGRGPKNEVWNLFDDLPEMLDMCRQILAPENPFFILTSYAVRASFVSMHELCQSIFQDVAVPMESGELIIQDETAGRMLSTSLFTRFGSAAQG